MAYEINININGDVENINSSGDVAGMSKTDSNAKSMKALGKYVAAQTIEPFIQNVKTQVTQNIQIVTGNSELQQRVNFGIQAVQFGVNTYKNAQAGAVVASSVGLSAASGATLGVMLSVLSATMQIMFNQSQLNLQKRVESYQLKQLHDRQGIAYNRSRS